jgi:ankyrin repeat protein
MTLTELQEIAIRQQQQIEINQQLLMAKEKRLKVLKMEEQRNQQLFLANNMAANLGVGTGVETAPSSNMNMNMKNLNLNENAYKLESLKQNVLSQELKIFKLKQLRDQILEQKLSNSNMYSELDLIKNLFAKKESDLFEAMAKVNELTKQIEQLKQIEQHKKMKAASMAAAAVATANGVDSQMNASELEKLKQELQIRNKLNEQQAKKIQQQQELFHQKQMEVHNLDKRIEELQSRIAQKRALNEQISLKAIADNASNQYNAYTTSGNSQNNSIRVANLQAQQQQILKSKEEIALDKQQASNLQQVTSNSNVASAQTAPLSNMATTGAGGCSSSSSSTGSPSKISAKYATKQEIANTYMNKIGTSEAYQRFQMAANMRTLGSTTNQSDQVQSGDTSQHHQSSLNLLNKYDEQLINEPIVNLPSNENSARKDLTNFQSYNGPNRNSLTQQQVNKLNVATATAAAATAVAMAPSQQSSQSSIQILSHNIGTINTGTELPSHLKLEFDKLKYLPDVVKTIKKRHSISEIEGSMHTVPPQIFQKMLEKHHKNFLDQQQQQQKLNKIKEHINEVRSELENDCSSNKATAETLVNSLSPSSKANIEKSENSIQNSNNYSTSGEEATLTINVKENINANNNGKSCEITMNSNYKSTKSIIKQLNTQQIQQTQQQSAISSQHHHQSVSLSRRVNFDPHALLLDAAVEGEIELVVKCAKQVKDVSMPNDEGITALHNSVCAGHFDIVKFLVEFGCDINYADNDGWTPLHCAASCNNLPMVKFLIEHGASVYATTLSDNETSIKKCEEDEDGYEACKEYLLNAQKNLGDKSFNNGIVYALYSYEAQNEDELTFKCSDKLIILEKHENEENGDANDGWWTAKLVNENKQGLVPNNFLGVIFLFIEYLFNY